MGFKIGPWGNAWGNMSFGRVDFQVLSWASSPTAWHSIVASLR